MCEHVRTVIWDIRWNLSWQVLIISLCNNRRRCRRSKMCTNVAVCYIMYISHFLMCTTPSNLKQIVLCYNPFMLCGVFPIFASYSCVNSTAQVLYIKFTFFIRLTNFSSDHLPNIFYTGNLVQYIALGIYQWIVFYFLYLMLFEL